MVISKTYNSNLEQNLGSTAPDSLTLMGMLTYLFCRSWNLKSIGRIRCKRKTKNMFEASANRNWF